MDKPQSNPLDSNTALRGSQYAQNGQYQFVYEAEVKLKRGKNEITLLSNIVGLPNYGAYFDNVQVGISGSVQLVAQKNNTEVIKDITKNVWNYKMVNKNYLPQYGSFYKALREGNWDAARKFLNDHPEAVNARINIKGKTALHIAALFGHLHIVEELVQLMSVEDVELLDFVGLSALHEATYTRIIKVAKCLVEKNDKVLTIPEGNGINGLIPVTRALHVGHEKMARYLYVVTPLEALTPENGNHGATLLNQCYYYNMLDIALDLLKRCPSLAVAPDRQGSTFLRALASIPSSFPSGCQLLFWQRWIYKWIHIQQEPASANTDIPVNMPETSSSKSENMMSKCLGINKIYEIKLAHVQSLELLLIACHEISTLNEEQLQAIGVHSSLLRAIERGITEFVIEVIKVHTHLLWECGSPKWGHLFYFAVQFRQAKVFSLIHGTIWKHAIANDKDIHGNNLLHMAGTLAPSTQLYQISGAALQMQRELQWFKEVESITAPMAKESLDSENMMTARALFTKNHKDLLKDGEKWMKGTARSCFVVATLVATIVFAAAFTVPGGNDQTTGYPIFSKKELFTLFIISEAISLFSSSTSLLMFLGILTSRYAEDDFLKSLPTKLIIGLSTLFISIATMMIAFCAALFVMLHGKAWIAIPVIFMASVPVTFFVWLQFPLLIEISMSTYGPSIFEKNVKRWL